MASETQSIVRTARRVKVQFVVESEIPAVTDDRPMVGIDLGIKSRVALSTGETVPGAKIDRRELKRRQRRLSKARKGGRNRRKRRAELAREWQRVTERERGALHELTTALVRDVSASFAVEDLKVENMVRNRRLSRSIHEQQWGALVGMLAYKARVPVGGWWRSPRIIRRGSAAGADDGRPPACRFGRIVAGAAW